MIESKLAKIILIACFTAPIAAFADQAPATPAPVDPGPPATAPHQPVPPMGKPYYQCSAHNTEDDFWLHYGAPAETECDAQASAVKACEDFEKHECEVHDCRYFIH